jgi:AmpD protein
MGRGARAGAGAIRRVASPNCDSRPPGAVVSLLLLHSISLPPGEYGGDAVERLFTNRLDPSSHPSFAALAGLRVSAHFLIRRDGETVQFVPVARRAWHAGASRWRGRERCNDISVGVELEGIEEGPFTDAQYERLDWLLKAVLLPRWPIRAAAAHADVAPGRKRDPGAKFAWRRMLARLARA